MKCINNKYLALSLFVAASGAVNAETLKSVVAYSMQNSPDLFVSVANSKVSSVEHRGAYSGFLPKIDLTGEIGREKTVNVNDDSSDDPSLNMHNLKATISQPLFDGFATKNNVQDKFALKKASHSETYSTMQDVSLRAIEVYLEVLRRTKLVELAKQNLADHQNIYKQIKSRSEGGIGKQVDLDQALGRLSLARTNLMTEQANLRDSEANYIRMIGKKPTNLVTPSTPRKILPASEAAAISLALDRHPKLKAATAKVHAANAQKMAVTSSFFPKVNLEVSAGINKNTSGVKGKKRVYRAAIKCNYNLMQGGADKTRLQANAWRLESAKYSKMLTFRQVEQSTRLAWNAFTSAQAQLRYYKQHAVSTEKTRNAYKKQFQLGQRTLLDLLDSENELFTSKSKQVDAVFTDLLGRFRVLNSMGILADYLKLDMPNLEK